ncbi:MAG TPA: Gfo/Idh/MocA family oxidoreductase [Tepidisphaeraceae bacterium]|jgi:predicted dehydrogenase|nr:Gfo/Idh/MocA family oxidoreductase [Tepidisphaeraceae bacterium]
MSNTRTIGIGIIGSGQIALANHLPGFALAGNLAKVVALCDANAETVARAGVENGIEHTFTDHREMLKRDEVQAVVVATPNFTHRQIVLDAVAAGKHVLCEKPLALNYAEALEMYRAAEKAKVRHMTAFTYRFVPAVRYMRHLVDAGAVGKPYHFRANRFQDWGDRNVGWRQVDKLAGSGELGDMLSHRIDYGHYLVGPITRLVADMKRFLNVRGGQPSDVDDFVSMLAEFENGATGVLESTKLATGHGEGIRSEDYCEINGIEGTVAYRSASPWQVEVGSKGGNSLRSISVPMDYLKWPGSTRDPFGGDPQVSFRWDQDVEFVRAIAENRPCTPSFADGLAVQAVMEATIQSSQRRAWVDVKRER